MALYIELIGGIGNQIFGVAFGLGMSQKFGIPVYFKRLSGNGYRLLPQNLKIFSNLDFVDTIPHDSELLVQKSFLYMPFTLEKGKNYRVSIGTSGYFQSYEYYKEIPDTLRNKIILLIETCAPDVGSKRTVAVHIRLTDYAKFSNIHVNQPPKYYADALLSVSATADDVIILFSDDYEKATEIMTQITCIPHINARDICKNMDDFTKDEVEMALLASCDVKICANSTFSLWACLLAHMHGREQKCIFPRAWFGPSGPRHDIHQLVPPLPGFSLV